MNPQIQHKIEELKKMATKQKPGGASVRNRTPAYDGLSGAIHTKKDADIFMAELKAAVKQAE